jgi:teichuronic acid biosynthesis glycosyltransferase TuaC
MPPIPESRASNSGAPNSTPLRVLTVSSVFPNAVQPVFGTFVLERARALSRIAHTRVVAPVAWFPEWIPCAPYRWRRHTGIPPLAEVDGIRVFHPRRLVIPRVARASNARSYARALKIAVRAALAEAPIDVIDAHFVWPDGYAAVEVGAEFGIPVCITGHGSDLTYAPAFRVVGEQSRTALRNASRVITVSRSLAAIAEELGARPDRLAVVPNGVDLQMFHPLGDRSATRHRFGVPNQAKLIVGVGALVQHKGFDAAVRALAKLERSGSSTGPLLVLVGDGPERGRLQRIAQSLGVSDRLRMVGSRTHAEVALWMGIADALVLPSHREGWPTVLFESWACGTPIVAAPVHGVPEAFDRAGLGILLQDRDPHTIAAALGSALDKRWDAEPMWNHAAQHTWSHVADRTLSELRLAAGLEPSPRHANPVDACTPEPTF